MIKINIYLEDLKEEKQDEVWEAIQKELLARRDVEYRDENETEEQFRDRLNEEIDYYINCHNFANEFVL